MKAIIELLHTKRAGYTRGEIVKKLGLSSGGQLTENLQALIDSDFVERYIPFSQKRKEEYYKLTDPFCIFWLRFVNGHEFLNEHLWHDRSTTHEVIAWQGLSYELVCFRHIEHIKRALGISGIRTIQSAWIKESDDDEKEQIDLLIHRNDNEINACEIQFTSEEFRVNQDYYRKLLQRQNLIQEKVSPKISIHQTLITTFGLAYNEYSSIFSNVIKLDQLFT